MVIILADSLTQERDNETYSLAINKSSNSSTVLSEALKHQSKNSKITSDNISKPPWQMAQLMNTMLENRLHGTPDSNDLSLTITTETINIEIPIDSKSLSKLIYKQEQHQNDDENRKPKITKNFTSYTVSQPDSMIPKLINVKYLLNQYLSQSNSYTNVSLAVGELRKYYQKLKEARLLNSIDDLMSVFSDVVFPFNKFTRRRAALRGSSLYLSDLIKAMTSEWSYKKIFSLKLAGGKRDHALFLVLDITVSMFGNMVLFYLEKVTIIATHEHTFDSYAIYTLSQQIKFDQENDSKDTFDLGVAIDLLTNCATRRERKIFILTDGYGNCAGLLPMVQQHAEDLDIDLIVLGIGIDRKNLQLSYAQYIQYTGGSNVPKELRSLCENEPQFKSIDLLKQSEDFTTQAVTTEVESIINETTQVNQSDTESHLTLWGPTIRRNPVGFLVEESMSDPTVVFPMISDCRNQ
ncbi:unnamed protein product [Rotaria magnacalcarata]|uniref:VWFA domain-containing protein n=3 Tax=Rotaria magnacalcarata TaxID=392030 RepID=A0A819NMD7_9BILA|nr:unnamed protein product [Rotaria magnacalcarata]